MNVQLLYDELRPLYEQLLKDVSYENCPSRPDEICTFCAQWGDKYEANDGVIFYGRAVNGWGTNENINSLFPQDFQNPNDEERTFNKNDQMIWVQRDWNNTEGYSTNRSAFWRVIRKISEHFYGDDWYRKIIWSNLYKVAPNGGNPGNLLCSAQLEICCKIMKKELKLFNSKHVVLLTGFNWAKEFLSELNNKTIPNAIEKVAWDNYTSEVYKIGTQYFYLTQHPQGKPEEAHVDAIIKLIEKYS